MDAIILSRPRGVRWLALYKLYRTAFPRPERKPFWIILKAYRQGTTDIWCFENQGKFVGFVTTMNGTDLIMLDYFAVAQSLRGKGIGTAALKQVLARYPDKGIFLEIESAYEPGADQEKRQKRKAFYIHCGLEPLNVMANVFGVPMELLGIRCRLDFQRYHNFYRDNYRKMALKHITKMEHPNENKEA